MESVSAQCAKCTVIRCGAPEKNAKLPSFCVTKNYPDLIKESIEKSMTDEAQAVHLAWSHLEERIGKDRYSRTRLEEVIAYAQNRDVKKIGIAHCISMRYEAKLLTNILEDNEFEVISVCCLAGEVTREDVHIESKGVFCNPVMQASVLNRESTQLNILLGLCVGHDSLFIRHSDADVTPLVVRDGQLGNNPAVALYLSAGPWKGKFKKKSKA